MNPEAQCNTIACLTPVGVAAIATLAITGPDAWSATRALLHRPGAHAQLPVEPEAGRFWFGRLGDSGDEVVAAVKEVSPHPRVEIHCHGGVEVVRFLQEMFVVRGFTVCSAWSLSQAEAGALEALARAPTVRTAAILLDQYHGAFSQAMGNVTHQGLEELRSRVALGRHLIEPWRVVLAGPPNVGKSSLVNAIAGYARSVVSPIPGTTRDVVTAIVALDGWPVQLTDTAGLRPEGQALEQAGMDRARTAIAQADLRLWVLDGAKSLESPPAAGAWHVVINKIDLPPAWNWEQLPQAWLASAKTGQGVSELCQAIAATLVPEAPPPGAAVPFTAELCDMIKDLALE